MIPVIISALGCSRTRWMGAGRLSTRSTSPCRRDHLPCGDGAYGPQWRESCAEGKCDSLSCSHLMMTHVMWLASGASVEKMAIGCLFNVDDEQAVKYQDTRAACMRAIALWPYGIQEPFPEVAYRSTVGDGATLTSRLRAARSEGLCRPRS